MKQDDNDEILLNLKERYTGKECCATCNRLGIFRTTNNRAYFACRKDRSMHEKHFLDIRCEDYIPQ